jgi:hypothetical protein
MKEKGQGSPDQKPKFQNKAQSKEQGSPKAPSEAGKDYTGILSSIRADQDVGIFVADIRQNKEQLISLARKLMAGKIRASKTVEGAKDNIALGLYIDLTLRSVLNPDSSEAGLFSSNPADYPDENSDEPLTEAERREILADWAAERVASKWLDDHPDSIAAWIVAEERIIAASAAHRELLQEMWPAIRYMESLPEKKK